jgi:hypothetical protein
VCVHVFQKYSSFSVLVGRYSRLLNSPPFLMIQGLFKSIITWLEGPNKTTGARSYVPEIFHIFCFDGEVLWISQFSIIKMFMCNFPYLEGHS